MSDRIDHLNVEKTISKSSLDHSQNDLKILLLLLGCLGLVLAVTTIRGAFIIDEINYTVNVIGLREGRLTVPGTEGLSPSKELLYFDPEPYSRTVSSTPVSSIAPPLYAPIALPFVIFGWRGLAFLNTISFVFAALLVFLIVRRHTTESSSAWLAVALFVLGGYSMEYAQGVWPHMLSVFLCTAAVYCVCSAWAGGSWVSLVLGGFVMGLGCGVRDQNIFLAGCLGLTVLFWTNRRLKSIGYYMAGIATPLLASATINFYRSGIFYPTPKAYAYAQFVSSPIRSGTWIKPFEVFWVKIVDFSTFSFFKDPSEFVDYAREPSTGAFLVAGIVKKALIQSSPWIAFAIVLCVAIWLAPSTMQHDRKRYVRALTLLVLPALGMFSMAGFRMDGLSFNQRYLLEIVPIAAIIVALCLDGFPISPMQLIWGFLFAGISFAILLIMPSTIFLHTAILKVPLLLGVMLVFAWIFRNRTLFKRIFCITLGLCIGWSFLVQTVDLITSRRIRTTNAVGLDSLSAKIPNHAALFAFWGAQKSMAGPIQFGKDVVILDVWADMGKDARLLAEELIRQKRRVFIYGSGIPTDIVAGVKGHDSLAVALTNPFLLYELVRRDSIDPADVDTSTSLLLKNPW